eukprot:4944324-Amphidinium_carterae.1
MEHVNSWPSEAPFPTIPLECVVSVPFDACNFKVAASMIGSDAMLLRVQAQPAASFHSLMYLKHRTWGGCRLLLNSMSSLRQEHMRVFN